MQVASLQSTLSQPFTVPASQTFADPTIHGVLAVHVFQKNVGGAYTEAAASLGISYLNSNPTVPSMRGIQVLPANLQCAIVKRMSAGSRHLQTGF